MEQHSATRNAEILPFATTRMDLDDITPSEISQTEKAKNHIISLMWDIKLKSQTQTAVWR